ncbi:MAG: hypothetical protein J6M41_09065 [Prevotella sp.]|nr:hypothetical protein [Prevotella sp.]
MNLSEQLSRGNWLFFRNNVRAFAFKVEQVTRRKVGYHAEPGESRMHYLQLCECQPIPLDARQLEKNGWKYNGEDAKFAPGTWTGGGLMLEPEGDGFRIVVTSDYDDEDTNRTPFVLHYLHELQNALRLCDIEREIIAY